MTQKKDAKDKSIELSNFLQHSLREAQLKRIKPYLQFDTYIVNEIHDEEIIPIQVIELKKEFKNMSAQEILDEITKEHKEYEF